LIDCCFQRRCRLFEDKLRDEIERRELIAEMLEANKPIRLDLEDSEGRAYVGKFDGVLLGEARGVWVYLTDDERVIVYEEDKGKYSEMDDPEEDLADWFPHDQDVYLEVMHALGQTPEIDL
jgi:hypothetical protein